MPNEASSNETEHDDRGTDPSTTLSRRTVLSGIGASGALLAGMGTASANGQGGQAVVHERDYKPGKSFVITEVAACPKKFKNPDGSCWAPPLNFQCKGEGGPSAPGKGGALPFPYWHFRYPDDDSDDPPRRLYTRDNKVLTDIRYRWPGNAKECYLETESPWEEDSKTVVQTGFTSVNDPD